jgi:hypothetical protein
MVALGKGRRHLKWRGPETTGEKEIENSKEAEWNKKMRLNIKIMMKKDRQDNNKYS